jgi:hypothetical protein
MGRPQSTPTEGFREVSAAENAVAFAAAGVASNGKSGNPGRQSNFAGDSFSGVRVENVYFRYDRFPIGRQRNDSRRGVVWVAQIHGTSLRATETM